MTKGECASSGKSYNLSKEYQKRKFDKNSCFRLKTDKVGEKGKKAGPKWIFGSFITL